MQICVTQKHIDDGCRAECKHCPIALAINEKLKKRYRVNIGRITFSIEPSHTLTHSSYKFSHRTRKFINDFDNYRPVQPFNFNAAIPKRYLCKFA